MATTPLAPGPIAVPPKPNGFDFFVLLLGGSVSLLLLQFDYPQITPRPGTPTWILVWLKSSMRFSEGIVLTWIILFPTQRLLGRTQPITSVEWLWIVTWLCVVVYNTFHMLLIPNPSLIPGDMTPLKFWTTFSWYVIVVPSIAALALLLAVIGAVQRTPKPWTHTFGAALLVWPLPWIILTFFIFGQLPTVKP
jgi:uncharacterized integral membrane protein